MFLLKNNDFLRVMKKKLYSCVDGKGLRQAGKVPAAHHWVSDGTTFLFSSDYMSSLHLRYKLSKYLSPFG